MLSFIIPIFEKDKILERCLKSLVDQSLKEWEAILVMDGPQENAPGIAKRVLRGQSFKIIEKPHGGACLARNEGFKHSQGEYVIFWDADCIIEPHAAKAWIDIFEKDKAIGFIYSGYKFLGEGGALISESFDPWLLKVRNYISSCFPLRRELFPGWDESLKSLQDWDFWLSVVERGGVGKFQEGYAFSTAFPDPQSISGQGCTREIWLERVDAVKKLHNLPERDTCISSLSFKHDGIALAKYLDADYQDYPNFKPHRYKNIVQIGFSLHPQRVEAHASIFNESRVKKFVFWTGGDIEEAWNNISFNAIDKYAILLNSCCRQFVEDVKSKNLMERMGFKVEILPMPFQNLKEIKSLPDKPKFVVDISTGYGEIFNVLDKCLPDVKLDILQSFKNVDDYNGLIHFYPGKTMTSTVKRMLLSGRHIISNIQSPFCGFTDDTQSPDFLLPNLVNKIREITHKKTNDNARDFYIKSCEKSKFSEILNAG